MKHPICDAGVCVSCLPVVTCLWSQSLAATAALQTATEVARQASTCSSPARDSCPGLVVVGGLGALTSAEVWLPGPGEAPCSLPSLSWSMYSHTLDSWQGRLIACYRDSCDQLTPSGWEQWKATLYSRVAHTSTVTPLGLLLVGGLEYNTDTTTELLPWNEGGSREGFRLEDFWAYHCSIQVTDSTFALTGGQFTGSQVTEFSLDSGGEVTSRELPRLLNDRAFHACGVYMAGGDQVISLQTTNFNR